MASDFKELIKAQQETTKALMSAEEAARYDALLAERQLEFNKKSQAIKAGLEAKKAKDDKAADDKQQAATEASEKEAAIANKKLLDIQKKPALERTTEEQKIFLEENNRKIEEQAKNDGIAFKDTKTWQKNQDAIALNNLKIREEEAGKDISASAQKEIDDERTKLEGKNQGLLGKIASGIGGLKEQGMAKVKSAGKGVMAILKGTLIAGFALAMVAFLNSKYWEDTKKVIVEDILPGLKKVFGFLKENAEAIGIGFASIVGAIAIVKFVAILQKIKLAFITMKTAMLATKASLVTTLAPLLPIIAVAAAIATVIFALKTAFEDFQKTLEETGSMGEALKVGAAKFIGFILGFIPSLVLKLVGFVAGLFGFDDFKKKVSTIDPIQFIADAFKDMFDKIQAFFGRLFTNPVAAINQLIGDTMTMITDFGGFIYRTVLKPAIDWVGNLFGVTDTSGQLEGFVGDKLNKILNFAAEIYEQYIKPIVDWVSDLFSKVASPVGAALSNAADMAKNFIKTILRSVLPKPGGSLFSIAGIASKAIPKGVYEFAGLNPETGDLITPAVGGGDLKPTTDGRAQQINEAGVARSGGGGAPIVVDAKSTNVVNSNSTSSATFTNTSTRNPNPAVASLNLSY